MSRSSIEWTDATWNPVRGCDKVSPGCKHCYAMGQAHRFSGPGQPYEGLTVLRATGPEWSGIFREVPSKLGEPLRWRKPRRIFVNSMSDLFGEGVSNKFIAAVFGVMAAAPQHTFQILTKRPERMRAWFERDVDHATECGECAALALGDSFSSAFYGAGGTWPLPNVWLGVSIESVDYFWRLKWLAKVPAAVRMVSFEPLLGAIPGDALREWLHRPTECSACGAWNNAVWDRDAGWMRCRNCQTLGATEHPALDWVIVGGESGRRARPMHPDWARGIRDEVTTAGVPFFFKQWGAFAYLEQENGKDPSSANGYWPVGGGRDVDLGDDGSRWMSARRVGKKTAGRLLDGRTWEEMPRPRVAP